MVKPMLACGILASVLYVGIVTIAGIRWDGYSSVSQTVSELFAIGAPVRSMVIPAFVIYAFLTYAFGSGVWSAAKGRKALKWAGALLILKELLGLVGTLYFPMHQRGVPGSLTDTMHAAVTALGVICLLAAVSAGAFAIRGAFRWISVVALVLMTVFGIWTGLDSPLLAQDLPTPWMGLKERVNIYVFMAWQAALAFELWEPQPHEVAR